MQSNHKCWAWGAYSGGDSRNVCYTVTPNPTSILAKKIGGLTTHYLMGLMSDSEYKRCLKELTKGM